MVLAEAIDFVRAGIVQVQVYAFDRDGPHRQRWGQPFYHAALGTGFLVSRDGVVVTAAHVIDAGERAASNLPNGKMEVGIAGENLDWARGNFTTTDFQVLARDARHDLAILQTARNPFDADFGFGNTYHLVVNGH